MITKQQVRAVIKITLNGKLLPLKGFPDRFCTLHDRFCTLHDIGIYLKNAGYYTARYYGLVEDYLNTKYLDLPDTIDEVKLSYTDILDKL